MSFASSTMSSSLSHSTKLQAAAVSSGSLETCVWDLGVLLIGLHRVSVNPSTTSVQMDTTR
uniref:Uncharacterized protein n=1 Tax=Leersia perrieri TaxID=77586 RepID=A0A0D9VY63_9ORYZ